LADKTKTKLNCIHLNVFLIGHYIQFDIMRHF